MSTTHEVVNQALPREGLNEYLINPALTEAVKRFDARWAADQLTEVGALVGKPDFQHDAELANTHPPVFSSHRSLEYGAPNALARSRQVVI